MKLKYYIRGFGAGMIITALIMTISNAVSGTGNTSTVSSTDSSSKTTSPDSIIAYTTAAATSKSDDSESKSETTGSSDSAVITIAEVTTGNVIILNPETSTADTTNETTTTAKATETATETVTESTTANNNSNQPVDTQTNSAGAVLVTIKNIYYGTQASDLLYSLGVIDDSWAFTVYMMDHGYDSAIKEGEYYIMPGSSYETVARAIMGL